MDTKIKCPHCGQDTTQTTGFCDECGIELASQALKPVTAAQLIQSGTLDNLEQPQCPHCGHKLRPNARHCPNCGKKLNTAAPVTPSESKDTGALQQGIMIANRYGLERVLGEGGMGRVWKAYDRNLNKHVVIKTVLTQDESLRKALYKEAQTLINIRHSNIISVIDFFTVENELCYVMEYIGEPSWADQIEEPVSRKLVLPMPAEEVLTRVKALLPAFKYLHGLNPPIIYCDFKPANVKTMTLPTGDKLEVLLDFGTAYSYDPSIPPKPARGTPGYHSTQASHPDWRDDYFTIGRTIAEMVGMSEVHTEGYRYTLTPVTEFPWRQYDDSLRYFVEWLTAPNREDRPQSVDEILAEIDGVIGYVRGQKPDIRAIPRAEASFKGVTLQTMQAKAQTGTIYGSGTVKIDLPEVAHVNPAATILLKAQEAYQQRDMTRALQFATQAINNNGGASAYILRSLILNQAGQVTDAEVDLLAAQKYGNPEVEWEFHLAQGQLNESKGQFEAAADHYRRMMAIKPGDHRGRLLLADLYRRSGNLSQAIQEYHAIIKAKPSIGAAYLGASKAYLGNGEVDQAITILEEVSTRNTSYNEVVLELIALYNDKALQANAGALEQSAHAITVLQQAGLESRAFYRLVAEFYFTAYQVALKAGKLPTVTWFDEPIRSVAQLSKANEKAWRTYLDHTDDNERDFIVNERIMAARTWALI